MPGKVKAIRVLAVIAVTLLTLTSIFLIRQPLLLLVAAIAIFVLVWYWPRFNVEYEYVYVDGQLDFDMILGGEKRKTALRIELDDADVIAPLNSEKMAGYQHLRQKNFTSLEEGIEPYAIATKLPDKEDKVVLLFEPNRKMIQMIWNKYGKKTYLKPEDQDITV